MCKRHAPPPGKGASLAVSHGCKLLHQLIHLTMLQLPPNYPTHRHAFIKAASTIHTVAQPLLGTLQHSIRNSIATASLALIVQCN